MQPNFIAIIIATLVPLIVGFIWYNPNFGFGKAWMAASGVTPDAEKSANMKLVFGLTIFFSLMIAFFMPIMVIHQALIYNFLHEQKDFAEPNSTSSTLLKQIMDTYGSTYRSFGHGMFHGVFAGTFLALPCVAIPALFERKGVKYVAINGGYWIVSLGLMGGVICAMA